MDPFAGELEIDPTAPSWTENDCCYFHATVDHRPVCVGLSMDALALLDASDEQSMQQAHIAIMQKFERYGLNAKGAVIVTQNDLVSRQRPKG